MSTPELARLEFTASCHSSWCANVGGWLQIELGSDRHVGSIFTQGAPDGFGFVKLYKLSYKPSNGVWEDYIEPGETAVKVLFKLF